MVFAFAGDSTMTSEVEPAGAGGPSSSTTLGATLRERALVADVFFLAADLRPAVLVPGRAALPRPAMRRVTVSSIPSDFFRAMLLFSERSRDRTTDPTGHTPRLP